MNDKPIYVSLDPLINAESSLVRRYTRSDVENNTIRDIIRKHIDPKGDDLNPSYTNKEVDSARQIQGWFDTANREPDYKVGVALVSEEGQYVEANLDDKLTDEKYASFVKTKIETDANTNAQEAYQLMDLVIRRDSPGGIEDKL